MKQHTRSSTTPSDRGTGQGRSRPLPLVARGHPERDQATDRGSAHPKPACDRGLSVRLHDRAGEPLPNPAINTPLPPRVEGSTRGSIRVWRHPAGWSAFNLREVNRLRRRRHSSTSVVCAPHSERVRLRHPHLDAVRGESARSPKATVRWRVGHDSAGRIVVCPDVVAIVPPAVFGLCRDLRQRGDVPPEASVHLSPTHIADSLGSPEPQSSRGCQRAQTTH